MTVLNELDRFHLAGAAIDRIAGLQNIAAYAHQDIRKRLIGIPNTCGLTEKICRSNPQLEMAGHDAPAAPVLLHSAGS